MKKIGLLILLCMFSVASFATSTPSGDKEKSMKTSVNPGIATPEASITAGMIDDNELVGTPASAAAEEAVAQEAPKAVSDVEATTGATEKVVYFQNAKKQQRFEKRVEKVKKRIAKKQDGGSSILGVLALVFGLLGFLLGWLIWPIGLLFAIAAIILGAIGMGGGRPGKGMAIVGLIFGILTIVLPVLIIALLIAAFA
jgi:hypothetical protein